MIDCPIRRGGQLFAVAALTAFSSQATANTARFYDDGLRGFSQEKLQPSQDVFRTADTSRFYDDGLTLPARAAGSSEFILYEIGKDVGPNRIPITQFPIWNWPSSLE